MTLKIIPFDGPIGAEVCGVDLAQLMNDETVQALIDAWHKHVLLLFRNQHLTDEQLKKSANWLGETSEISMPVDRRGDDDSQIQLVSNILSDDGAPIGAFGDGEMWFHHDMSYRPEPHKATLLHALELPSKGGNTKFANMYLGYKNVPAEIRKRVRGRKVLQAYNFTMLEKVDLKEDLENIQHQWQPIFVKHPETEKTALYVSRLISMAIEGLERKESNRILSQLIEIAENSSLVYEHVWQDGDLTMWDNRCSTHARTDFPPEERRLLRRCTIEGGEMIAAA